MGILSTIGSPSSSSYPTLMPTTSEATAFPSLNLTNSLISNSSFESPVIPYEIEYEYRTPTGWQCSDRSYLEGGCVMILSGSGPWGGTNAASGSQFIGLQNSIAFISQTITLLGNSQYRLSFYASCRLYYDPASLSVTLDGVSLYSVSSPPQDTTMQYYSFTFQTSSSVATQVSVLSFQNTGGSGEKTVFIDAVDLILIEGTCRPDSKFRVISSLVDLVLHFKFSLCKKIFSDCLFLQYVFL